MSVLKRLEGLGKWMIAALLAILLWRPRRRARVASRIHSARLILLVRIDNRVGEALLTTPLLRSLRTASPPLQIHLLVHRKVYRVLEGHPDCDRVIPFDRTMLWAGPLGAQIRDLRRAGYDAVVDCANWTAPSTTSALVSRFIAGPSALIAPAALPSRWFADVPVSPRPDTRSELLQRLHLLTPLPPHQHVTALSFRKTQPTPPVELFLSRRAAGPFAVVNPGGRLGERRVAPEVFAGACDALLAAGLGVVVTWGPGEESLAQDLTRKARGAELAPATTLDDLATLMRAARLTVCNNTGPMHLSVAVATPTLAFFLRMDLERWGHSYAPHRMVDLTPEVSSKSELTEIATRAVRDFLASLDQKVG